MMGAGTGSGGAGATGSASAAPGTTSGAPKDDMDDLFKQMMEADGGAPADSGAP
jgi:hypothetical protein